MSMIPSFESSAAAIVTALESLDLAAGKSRDAIAFAMQSYIDAAHAAGLDKEPATIKALGAEIRGCQTFVDAAAAGMIESKTVTEYAQGAMRAYFHGVPWAPTLKNNPDYALPGSKAASAGAAKRAAKPAKVEQATPVADSSPAAPSDAKEGRETVRNAAIILQRWANANMSKLDLATREVVENFRASVEGLAK
jgi:hypothetical protein